MGEPRCDLTDLYVSQCGCKVHRNSPDPLATDMTEVVLSGRTFTAVRDGGCGVDSSHRIVIGDTIHLTVDHGWVCAGCAQKAVAF